MAIRDIHNPWRDRLQQASFRGVGFHVEQHARASGRRAVVHEYPKRNTPYSEDMGRRARRWHVQGYLIGPRYLAGRDALVAALEADGPATLVLPLPWLGASVQALAGGYTFHESRDRGGFVVFEMEFSEAGSPGFGTEVVDTRAAIDSAARAVEDAAGGVRT